ncbi:LIM domain and actin-binding protein 1 [Pelomyxa schiedti]|nr:LIM domain and actin-binding protein 1 [Pelomyxa schiedti]
MSGREKCKACQKTVYPLERVAAANKDVFHKTCFRCTECNKVLPTSGWSILHEKYYCKPHMEQLFKTKGNYDEAFGHKKHSANWKAFTPGSEGAAAETPAATTPATTTTPAETPATTTTTTPATEPEPTPTTTPAEPEPTPAAETPAETPVTENS